MRRCCSLLLLVSIGDGFVLTPPPRPSATGTRGFCRLNALGEGGGTRVAPWRRRARFAAAAVSPSLAAAAGGDGEGRGAAVRRVLDGATSLFPLWVFGAAVLGAARPELLARFARWPIKDLVLSRACRRRGTGWRRSHRAQRATRPLSLARPLLSRALARFARARALGGALAS